MRVFFDASALVKRYVPEDGTALLNEIFVHLPLAQMTCAMPGILEIVTQNSQKKTTDSSFGVVISGCCGLHSRKGLTYLIPK